MIRVNLGIITLQHTLVNATIVIVTAKLALQMPIIALAVMMENTYKVRHAIYVHPLVLNVQEQVHIALIVFQAIIFQVQVVLGAQNLVQHAQVHQLIVQVVWILQIKMLLHVIALHQLNI